MMDLTILMPCLNEEENIGHCIHEAMGYLKKHSLNGEVLIVDNGSTDRSTEIAAASGARVVHESKRGYGSALRSGLRASRSTVIIFGDSDSTYDFSDLDAIYLPLARHQYDVIIGNRFAGLMETGAMNLSHRLGVPFLSWCARKKFKVNIHDFHCGIRGIRKDALEKLDFRTTGMEFATEMIAEAGRKGLRTGEVPVPLKNSICARQKKLRTIRDGCRHLWYILKA